MVPTKRCDQNSRYRPGSHGWLGDLHPRDDAVFHVFSVEAEVEDTGIEPLSLLLGQADDFEVAIAARCSAHPSLAVLAVPRVL